MVSANELKDIPLRHVEPESLGMLARTQAAADLSILIERGRRCMHLHLPDNSGVTIRALGDAAHEGSRLKSSESALPNRLAPYETKRARSS